MSLRARFVAGLIAVSTIAMLVADLATYAALDSYLHGRIDTSLTATHRAAEQLLGSEKHPTTSELLEALEAAAPGDYIELRDAAGRTILERSGGAHNPPASRPRLPTTLTLGAATGNNPLERVSFLTAPAASGAGHFRVRTSRSTPDGVTLVVATSLSELEKTLPRLRNIEALVTIGVLLATALAGYWVVGLGLRPLDEISETAARIGDGDLSHRVARDEPRTEIGRLGNALNSMLHQIETAFAERAASAQRLRDSDQRLRRFAADASHELRTPLAAVRAYAELFERGADKRPADLARAMSGIARESERMSVLVNDLLVLARFDDKQPLRLAPARLDEIAGDAVEAARAVDPDRQITLESQPVEMQADANALRQVLDNLLANVRAHTPARAPARVQVARHRDQAVVEVTDAGPGLTPDQQTQVFERFFRADPSRSRQYGGAGLGLSIAAAIVHAHAGTIAANSARGGGTTIRVTLPLRPEPSASAGTQRADETGGDGAAAL